MVASMLTEERYPADSARNSPSSVMTVYRCEMPSLTFPAGVSFRRWQNKLVSASYIGSRPRIANSNKWVTRVSLAGVVKVVVISVDSFLHKFQKYSVANRLSLAFDNRDDVLNDGVERRTVFSTETLLVGFPAHRPDLRSDVLDRFQQDQAPLVRKVAIDCANFPAKNTVDRNSQGSRF